MVWNALVSRSSDGDQDSIPAAGQRASSARTSQRWGADSPRSTSAACFGERPSMVGIEVCSRAVTPTCWQSA